MAYEARRNDYDDEERLKEEHDHNNAKNTAKTAAKAAATYAAGPVGGKVVDIAAKTKLGDKALNRAANNINKVPGLKKASNAFNDSGMNDLANKAIDVSSKDSSLPSKGLPESGKVPGAVSNQTNNTGNIGGGQNGSLPSSVDGEKIDRAINNSIPRDSSFDEIDKDRDKDDNKKSNDTSKIFGVIAKNVIMMVAPFILIFILILFLIVGLNSFLGSFNNLFGISFDIGSNTGGIEYSYDSKEQEDFFNRVSIIQKEYESKGSSIDVLKVVAVYDILNMHGANLSYEDMTDARIREFVDAMLLDGMYNEEEFRNNLISKIFPKYLKNTSKEMKEQFADEVLEHVKNYRSLIGEEENIDCSSTSCKYNIKGYIVDGKKTIDENINVSDLYVRLMQCGVADGHNYGGTFGKALAGEELIPFENYVLGVAYQEVDTSIPAEAIKAQLVATRSFILARHAVLGGWRTLKEEDGKWVLQVAACSQDQVYCDPDKGCSSNSLQWGQIHSGLNHNSGFSKQPLAGDSPLRTYVNDTKGELLVNKEGYIIYSQYSSQEKQLFSSLASKGLSYKQILLQVYNQGSKNYGASDIKKSNCGVTSNLCSQIASGEFANWKQYQGPWISVPMGTSGLTIKDIGCLTVSVSMLIAKSGKSTNIANFNPGTFVQFLNTHGGIDSLGNYQWYVGEKAAPSFKYQGQIALSGMSREEKLNKIKEVLAQGNTYITLEVKGITGQHWVAVNGVQGDNVIMMDPGSNKTDLWGTYYWGNTSVLAYYKVTG